MRPPRPVVRAPFLGVGLAFAAAVFAHGEGVDNRYAVYSDAELTEVAGQWQSLDDEARRDFFIEVRRRMGEPSAVQSIPVRVERRFGKLIRGPNGTVLRIERFTRFEARRPNPQPAPPVEYGTGFEQRVADKRGGKEAVPPAPPRGVKVRLVPAKTSGEPPDG